MHLINTLIILAAFVSLVIFVDKLLFFKMTRRHWLCELDLPGKTTAMDGGSAGAAGSGSSKNLEGLHA
jgi:hypothetical protein